jgi:CDP-diacylglycerol---serine O-phosphatidyltransferase
VKINKVQRGIYVLPSLFTTVNLLAGCMAIICAMDYRYAPAAWAIIIAIVMDMLDGRIARWTNTTSKFGIEFDSIADTVSFGLAPAILIYKMVLSPLNRLGIAITLFYVLSSALRLARFNVKAHDNQTSSDFSGLPTPASAGILASFVLSYQLFEVSPEASVKTLPIIMDNMPFFYKTIPILMILVSFLMVSTVPYNGFKKLKLNRPKPLQILFFILIGLFLILMYPQNIIFIIFLFYLLSGMTGYISRLLRLRRPVILYGRDKSNTSTLEAQTEPPTEENKNEQ